MSRMYTYILLNWNAFIPCDPAIPFLYIFHSDIYLSEIHAYVHQKTCSRTFTATLFKPKLLKCPSVTEWIMKYSQNKNTEQ